MKTIRIDGVIGTGSGEISSNWFADQLPTDGSAINVRIHSEGGSVIEGFRIFDLANAYTGPKTCTIESAAYSIASFIPMAFDEVEIAPNGYMMLHNPYMGVEGDDEELAAKAAFLAKLKTNMVEAYAKKSGMPVDQVTSILKAESYLNAREVVAAGFADRMTSTPVIGRVFAKLETMPHGVVSALFGANPSGNNDSAKGKTMSESKPVAATVKEIKSAFPALAKAKPSFVVDCIEKELPLASVASAAAEEMMNENEELKAKVAAMEEELAKAKAKAEEEDDEEESQAKAEEEDGEEAEAKARRRGVQPVAKGTAGRPSATARWNSAVDAKASSGLSRPEAIMAADRDNPGLRQSMLDEVNAR